MRIALPLLTLFGCNSGVICPDGYEELDDACVPSEEPDTDEGDTDEGDTDEGEETDAPDLGDIITDAQPCARLAAADRLDVTAGCADGVCAGSTFSAAVNAAGRPEGCQPGTYDGWFDCTFRSGVAMTIINSDQINGPSANDFVYYVQVAAPWGGADPSGLGLGISPGCFVETLGTPTYVSLQTVEGETKPWTSYAYWEPIRLVIQDNAGRPQPYQPDGRVDIITMYGPEN